MSDRKTLVVVVFPKDHEAYILTQVAIVFLSHDFRAALDRLKLKRYCCRRMLLTHVDLLTKLLSYNSKYSYHYSPLIAY